MLLSAWLSFRFSASITASLPCSFVVVAPFAPGMRVPFDRSVPPPPMPDASAVPAEFVPGELPFGLVAGAGLARPVVVPESNRGALPLPLGSFPALFWPAALAGPGGTPLVPSVPAPAEPALGEPTALPVPDDAPPPALPPPPLPPPLWA